ncbi:hypothetical protein [Aureivirga marina]|uniref:hypothetical protein n=1 Tax=Aureivirga marina TaxID=1182451 RepID=UPI0018CBB8B2|nr:hypothetical protein [Aureivirga marina]
MKLKEKVVIDFEVFFSKGKFDFLKLGKTKEWILHNFPDPDDLEEFPEIYKSSIWRYGNIELHFDKDELWLIFSDYINELDGGNTLELKKWFLDDIEKLTLSNVISHLNEKNIDFCKKTNFLGQRTICLELESGVNLGFCLEIEEGENYEEFDNRSKNTTPNLFKLQSFSFKK